MTNLTYKYVPLYKIYSDILAKLRISKARIIQQQVCQHFGKYIFSILHKFVNLLRSPVLLFYENTQEE